MPTTNKNMAILLMLVIQPDRATVKGICSSAEKAEHITGTGICCQCWNRIAVGPPDCGKPIDRVVPDSALSQKHKERKTQLRVRRSQRNRAIRRVSDEPITIQRRVKKKSGIGRRRYVGDADGSSDKLIIDKHLPIRVEIPSVRRTVPNRVDYRARAGVPELRLNDVV